jgi:hypothetical protein
MPPTLKILHLYRIDRRQRLDFEEAFPSTRQIASLTGPTDALANNYQG